MRKLLITVGVAALVAGYVTILVWRTPPSPVQQFGVVHCHITRIVTPTTAVNDRDRMTLRIKRICDALGASPLDVTDNHR